MRPHLNRPITIPKPLAVCASILTVAFAFSASTPTPAFAGSATGLNGNSASIAPNPFDINLDGNPEITTDLNPVGSGPTSVEITLENLVNRRDSRSTTGGSRVLGNVFPPGGFAIPPLPQQVEYSVTANPGPFTVGTIITAQYIRNYSSPSDFELSLLTPAASAPATLVQTGPGLPNTHTLQITTLPLPIENVTGFSITQTLANIGTQGPTDFGDFNEVLFLADTYAAVNITSVTGSTANTGLTFGSLAGVADGKGGLDSELEDLTDAFYIGDPTPDRFVQLDFDQDEPVSGLVIANLVDQAVDIRIFDDTGIPIADVSLDADFPAPAILGSGGGEFLPVLFDDPVTTSHLRLEFLGSDPIGLREVIVLRQEIIPEPGTLAMVLLGALFVARRPV